MTRPYRDPALDTLLELHGETLFVDDAGHWVKFVAVRAEPTPERPHGLSYSLTLHAPDGARLVGFDHAHPVRERHGPGGRRRTEQDHRHRLGTVRLYEYEDAATLLEDFWKEVDRDSGREDRFHENTDDRHRRLRPDEGAHPGDRAGRAHARQG